MVDTENQDLNKLIANDMKKISSELSNLNLVSGAYCQESDTFKIIYHFVEHRLRRTRGRAFIILLTLTDGKNIFPDIPEKEQWMNQLKEIIQGSLRSGDLFTRYSKDQHLIMILDLSEKDAKGVVNRISEAFYKKIGKDKNRVMIHYCYPLLEQDL